jgi:hypothetical protein
MLQVATARRRATLEHRAVAAYSLPMDDKPHDTYPADRDPPMPTEAELLASLARSEADLAAGRIVQASVVHEDLRAAPERIEARRGQRRATVARR